VARTNPWQRMEITWVILSIHYIILYNYIFLRGSIWILGMWPSWYLGCLS
jgi:hypothetical protein